MQGAALEVQFVDRQRADGAWGLCGHVRGDVASMVTQCCPAAAWGLAAAGRHVASVISEAAATQAAAAVAAAAERQSATEIEPSPSDGSGSVNALPAAVEADCGTSLAWVLPAAEGADAVAGALPEVVVSAGTGTDGSLLAAAGSVASAGVGNARSEGAGTEVVSGTSGARAGEAREAGGASERSSGTGGAPPGVPSEAGGISGGSFLGIEDAEVPALAPAQMTERRKSNSEASTSSGVVGFSGRLKFFRFFSLGAILAFPTWENRESCVRISPCLFKRDGAIDALYLVKTQKSYLSQRPIIQLPGGPDHPTGT